MAEVTLTIDGKRHVGWTAARIHRSLDAMTGAFELSLTRRERTEDEPRTIAAGAACTLSVDGETLISGWIDRVSPSRAKDSHSIAVTGRDRAADLVDCSAIASPGSWRNASMESIVRALVQPFGLAVHFTASTGRPIRKFAIQPGETVQAAIERLCRFRGLIYFSRADGSIEIGSPATGASIGRLIEGDNILEISADHDVSDRFGTYLVKGQAHGDDEANGRAVAQIKAQAKDAAVTRYRPLLIVAEDQGDKAALEKRAAWEANVRAAKGQTANVTVQGWTGPDGAIWRPNSRVDLSSPATYIESTMLIVAVDLMRDEQGTVAILTLNRPEAWQQLAEPEGSDPSAIEKKKKRKSS